MKRRVVVLLSLLCASVMLLIRGPSPVSGQSSGPTTTQATDPVQAGLAQIQAAATQASAAFAAEQAANASALNAANATIAQLQQQLASTQRSARHFGVNLESPGNGYGDARGLLFADAMLQAQPWYAGHDANYNPTANGSCLVFTNCTANFAGTYKFICNGNVTPSISASYATIANVAYNATTNQTTADITITAAEIAQAAQLQLTLNNVVAGQVSNVQLWRPGANVGVDRYYAPFVKLLGPFDTIRFMNFLAVNGSTQVNWSDRNGPTTRCYDNGNGGCYEDALRLSKLAGKTPWLCVPCQANSQYLTNLISLIQQTTSGPVYIEWSNEIWNSAFPQWTQAMALAKADSTLAYDGTTDPNILLYRWMGKQAVLVGKAAMAAYGVSDIRQCPIRPILAGQWGNPQVLQYALAYIASQYGAPNQSIYGIAIAPYATLSNAMYTRIAAGDPTVTEQQIVADWQANGISNSSMANSGTAAFVAQAQQYSLHTRAYEFGFDSGQAQADVAQKIAAAHDPAIGPILTTYVNIWWAAGCQGLNWFTLTGADTSSGQWGLTTDTFDTTPPKYQAAVSAANATLSSH